MTPEETKQRTKWFDEAFSQGSDARLDGKPISANPLAGDAKKYWNMGWRDVETHWGEKVRGWAYKALPEIK